MKRKNCMKFKSSVPLHVLSGFCNRGADKYCYRGIQIIHEDIQVITTSCHFKHHLPGCGQRQSGIHYPDLQRTRVNTQSDQLKKGQLQLRPQLFQPQTPSSQSCFEAQARVRRSRATKATIFPFRSLSGDESRTTKNLGNNSIYRW